MHHARLLGLEKIKRGSFQMDIPPLDFQFNPHLAVIDWVVIGIYILFSIGIGLYFSRRGTRSLGEYFASGQGVPWWILGTSMVATTFAADTPLAISGLVVKQGIWGNWFWWSQIPIFVGGVFFFSRLWRRARILTDTQFVELRYSGKPARLLRGFRALYFAIPYNCLVMGWVVLSMTKIMGLTFNIDKHLAIVISLLITMAYSAVSGLWGVMVTDFFQFFLAMGMAIVLAVISVSEAGGLASIFEQMQTIYTPEKIATMKAIIPDPGNQEFFSIFIIYILLLWWTVGNTDGGAYFAQRMIAAKNEKHSFLGYLWFNVAHFCLRPWPWIIVGLVAAVKFPGIVNPHTKQPDPEIGYIAVMLHYLKPGILGLMLASFLAAFMSTISTQINWGASYLINDFYQPFIRKNAPEKHYIRVSILATLIMAVMGGAIALIMDDIFMAWLLFSSINAGIGVVYLVRWYWWRINAWSEMSAITSIILIIVFLMLSEKAPLPSFLRFTSGETLLQLGLLAMVLAPILGLIYRIIRQHGWLKENFSSTLLVAGFAGLSIYLIFYFPLPQKIFPWTLIYTVPISLVVWLGVTILTPPASEENLIEFYKRVHPGGPGWRPIQKLVTLQSTDSVLFTLKNFWRAGLSIAAVFLVLFGAWQLFIGTTWIGWLLFTIALGLALLVVHSLSDEKWESNSEK
jgi:Na+/proline symporter